MADRYWVGGSGTWDAATTTNWATTSGGAGGATAPTSADNVIFNSASNATLYTVTVGTNAVCEDLTVAAPASGNVTFSLGATAILGCYGSMSLPATGATWAGTVGAVLSFRATTTGKTITTNGVSITTTQTAFQGVGGGWTLGSAYTTSLISVQNGTFNSGNFNITGTGINDSGVSSTRAINLGSSTVTLSAAGVVTLNAGGSGLTLNAGTSQITCSNANPTFGGGGQTFYNVSFTNAATGQTTITGANTFNNLSQTSRGGTGVRVVSIGANQTVSGTLTLGAANTSVRRIQVQSDTIGTQRTITLNGTLATLADVDFRDIATAGSAGTWTGTRIGNGLGNSGITFDAAKDVYWNYVTGAFSWPSSNWALSSGGATSADNLPLAQDKVIIEDTGLASGGSISFSSAAYWIGELDISTRTLPMTINNGTINGIFYKNVTLSSVVTMTGTGAWQFVGQGTTQILDVNTATFVPPIAVNSQSGTLQLAENTTCSGTVTLTQGTLDLNNFDLTCNVFSIASGTNTKVIAFGTGVINVSGRNTAVLANSLTGSGFSYTGTPRFNLTGAGIAGETRSISFTQAVYNEANAVDVYVTAGADTVTTSGTGFNIRTLDFTGFTGTFTRTTFSTQFGNLVFSSGMTLNTTSTLTFAATSGTQLVTTNGKTLDFPVTQNGVGGTVQLQDDLTMGSSRTFTLTAGTLDLNNFTLNTGLFNSNNTNIRSIAFGTGNITVNSPNGSVFNTDNSTNFTVTGTPVVNVTANDAPSLTKLIDLGNDTAPDSPETNSISVNILGGTQGVSVYGSSFKNLNFTGFSGTWNEVGSITIYGDLTLSSTMTFPVGTNPGTNIFFKKTTGTQTATFNGVTVDRPINIDNITSGAVQLQDALTISSTRILSLSNGTLDINGKVLSVGNFFSSNSNTRAIDFGTSGELTVVGVGTTAFDAGTSTGLTVTGATAKINMLGATAKTFAGGGGVFPVTLVQQSTGTLTITGSNTFGSITYTG
jgi:hypothetical protein